MTGISALEPPKRQSLDRAAAESLRRAIVSGALEQGTRLTEASLAEQFSLSRGTVRSALQRLASEGLIVQRPYSGWDVVALSAKDAWEISTLRASLEALAAQLSAERMDDSGRAAIARAFAALKAAAEDERVEDLIAADLALHRTLVQLSGNTRLTEHYDLIANQIRLYIASSNMVIEQMATVVGRHAELIAPLLAGDAAAAEAAARAHSMRSSREILAYWNDARTAEEAPAGKARRGA
jgi:DNA-binding GntR family transcriptional regulator